MTPSDRWFPSNFADRAVWFQTFTTAFETIGPALGFSAGEVTAVKNDNAVMQWLVNALPDVDAYNEGLRLFRRTITEGPVDGTEPSLPVLATLPTYSPVDQGIFERLDNLVKRIRLAAGYSDEEGGQLGIIPKKPGSISPGDAKPALTADTDPDNVVFVKFRKGRFSGIFLQVSIDKGPWIDQGRFSRSPATLTIPQGPEELPRLVALRARYLDGDTAVGENSDVVVVKTTP